MYVVEVNVKIPPSTEFSNTVSEPMTAKAAINEVHSYKLQGGAWKWADYTIIEEVTGVYYSPAALLAKEVREWVQARFRDIVSDLGNEFAEHVAAHFHTFPPEEELQQLLSAFLSGVNSGMKQVITART